MKRVWVCLYAIFFLIGCSSSDKEFRTHSGEIWNTGYRVVYESYIELNDSIIQAFELIDRSVSVFNDSSLVCKVNRNEDVEVDSVFKRVFEVSRTVNEVTHGAFDPTVGQLIELYGFGRNRELNAPAATGVDSIMRSVGLTGCAIVNNRVIKKSPETTFNFSGIAKGYGVDLITEILRRNGVKNYMVEIGGDVAVNGHNADGNLWAILLEPIGQIIKLSQGAVATSGNYRKKNGENGHIIDPRTGKPTPVGPEGVSVVAPTCIMADALATAAIIADFDVPENVEIYKIPIRNDK